MLREEIHHLQEPGSYVGEVVKVMAKTKVLVKVRDVRDDRARAAPRPPRLVTPRPHASVVVLGVPTVAPLTRPPPRPPPSTGTPRASTCWV